MATQEQVEPEGPFYDEGQTYPVDPMIMDVSPVGGFQFWTIQSGNDSEELSVIFCREHRWLNLCLTPDMARLLGDALTRWADSQP